MTYRKRPVLKNDSFIERYPKLFAVSFVTICFGMLFSRPIYDFYMSYKSYKRQREMAKRNHLKLSEELEAEETKE